MPIGRYQVVLSPVDPPDKAAPIELDIDLTLEFPADLARFQIPPELLSQAANLERPNERPRAWPPGWNVGKQAGR